MTALRILLWFAIAAAAMLGAVWLAERPGTVTAQWHGWRLDTSVGVLVIAVMVLILVAVVLW
ncbi:MAG: heme biosynthesis protein HemY, partial [Reyranella sp.]|nr:heme biosynthesis protein HemY [Reyranella sp.]